MKFYTLDFEKDEDGHRLYKISIADRKQLYDHNNKRHLNLHTAKMPGPAQQFLLKYLLKENRYKISN